MTAQQILDKLLAMPASALKHPVYSAANYGQDIINIEFRLTTKTGWGIDTIALLAWSSG